jgi:hypothetical protein
MVQLAGIRLHFALRLAHSLQARIAIFINFRQISKQTLISGTIIVVFLTTNFTAMVFFDAEGHLYYATIQQPP